MNKYAVNIADAALADMEALYDYIANVKLAPENAMRQYNRIADAILTLDVFPDRFGILASEPEHTLGIHRMIVDNFLIYYVIDSGVVTVTDVLYGASDVHNRLRARYSEAMEEAKRLSRDPKAKRYASFSEALEDLGE